MAEVRVNGRYLWTIPVQNEDFKIVCHQERAQITPINGAGFPIGIDNKKFRGVLVLPSEQPTRWARMIINQKESWDLPVRMLGERRIFGRDEVQIEPYYGSGPAIWVQKNRILEDLNK